MSDLYDASDLEWEDGGSQGSYSAESTIDHIEEGVIPGRRLSTVHFEVLSREQLNAAQETSLDTVVNVLGCERTKARALLIHYQWDTERLMGAVADQSREEVFRRARVSDMGDIPTPSGEITCETCFCPASPSEATVMDCGHVFCNDCWKQHFRVQITEGKSRRLGCMAVGCGNLCNEDKVAALLSDPPSAPLLERYRNSIAESYVEDNRRVKWCPSVPHCGAAVRVSGEPYVEPTCSCGFKFCFNCTMEPHSPCTCDMWKSWKQKCEDDSETKNWLTAHTKPCPKCSKPVHKDGGCNLVVCQCGQAFCWLCGSATGREHTWTQIAGHSCGRYREEAEARAAQSERQLKRYLHYYSRWHAHMDSQRHEQRQRQETADKISDLEAQHDTGMHDYSWLRHALEQLCETRAILGYSYVFAYYMFGGEMFREEIDEQQNEVNKNLFEDQQQQLDAEVERLSGLISAPTESMDQSLRLTIINSANNVEQRTTHLYTIIENDLLGQLQCSNNYIAPYKGMSMLQMRVSASPAPEALAAALGQQHAEDSGVAGPSTDDTPQIVRIVHVLDDDVPYTRTRAAAAEARGKRPVQDGLPQEGLAPRRPNRKRR